MGGVQCEVGQLAQIRFQIEELGRVELAKDDGGPIGG